MSDNWLPSLKTDTPQAGFELAVKLSRMGVKITQPSDEMFTSKGPPMSRIRSSSSRRHM